jgi:hypothetical protein
LTSQKAGLQYPQLSGDLAPLRKNHLSGFMSPNPPPHPDTRNPMEQCKHPRVQIVSRQEDAEFVECLECGEVFESSEFKDMNIEDTKLPKEI